MKCTKCGYDLPADSEFCQYCGARLEKAAVVPANSAVAEQKVTEIPAVSPVMPAVQAQPVSPKEKTVKKRYCSRCGSLIDSETKVCTGCGKKYFKGIRLSKKSSQSRRIFPVVLSIVLAVILAASVAGNILQYVRYQEELSSNDQTVLTQGSRIINLQRKVNDLDLQVRTKDSTIKTLEQEIAVLEEEAWDNWLKLHFYDTYVEIVPDDGTRKYHKWGCSKLDKSNGFWIFNTEAAAADYKKCTYCH